MKLKALKSFRHGSRTFARGAAVDVTESVAKDLVKRGLASGEGGAGRPKSDPTRAKQKTGKAGD